MVIDYTFERFFVGVGLMAFIGLIYVMLHSLPEHNLRDRVMEWFAWFTAAASAGFILCPWKFFPPQLWLIGKLDDVAAALLLAFSAWTGGAAHHARLARDKFRIALANSQPEAA